MFAKLLTDRYVNKMHCDISIGVPFRKRKEIHIIGLRKVVQKETFQMMSVSPN
jgi:hypothetical protein